MKNMNFYLNLKKICLLPFAFCFFNLMAQGNAEPYDILINEFMPDPSPSVGLPNAEYIELYNRSAKNIDLKGFRLINGSVETVLPTFVLKSKNFVTLYTQKSNIHFGIYGDTLPVPKLISISNPGDTFYLKSPNGIIIDAASFDVSFYQNSKKSDGGWSLERINPNAPCLTQNWIASNDLKGGTPSKLNSVQKLNDVPISPQVLGFYLKDDNTVVVIFDKTLDRKLAVDPPQYLIDKNLKINDLKVFEPMFDKVEISFNLAFKKNEIYNLVVKNTLKDCQQTPLSKNDTIVIQLPEKPLKNDVIINEILLNPETGGARFIELYNRSEKVIDIANMKIADLKRGDVKPISSNFLLFPRKYVVLTDNPFYIQTRYNVKNYRKTILKNRLPSWADISGTIVIYTFEGSKEIMIDSFTYLKAFHNPLLANTEGVSLERIFTEKPSTAAANWQSAAASVGYATPAYQNSQNYLPSVSQPENAVFSFETPHFSPDGDGFEDVFLMRYKVDKEGYIGNFYIFNIHGTLIKTLKINEILASEGHIKWEGDDEDRRVCLSGTYIFYAELISPTGTKKKWKKAFFLTNG